ncbi:phosphosulfolactate synthase [Caldalkalibacillus thermarum]|uniref:phosphosulfolactate synthase n=1 Tax=Caldalkalibacillus thermarum TaxID=296745 RepID=UPI001669D446|nr:phosphosulfolactate synthase [Caldalkalibacillus thermarum]GGK16474.1 phosphosulfolactate synthase [Caldalkalibacillus thermarum]
MSDSKLNLPPRTTKPRAKGLTILIDNGVPAGYFSDLISTYAQFIDFVKFGWGTSIVSGCLEEKIDCLRNHQVQFFFGGTLFEKFLLQGKLKDYFDFCRKHGCQYIEISNGTVKLSNKDKASIIADFANEFSVFSEVGYKDSGKSLELHPAQWVEYILEDLEAGAFMVITEARESGTSGICKQNGELRNELIEALLRAGIDVNRLIFEAPNKWLQSYFIKRFGTNVNLANIPFGDVVALETLRLGLRSDTLYVFEASASGEGK